MQKEITSYFEQLIQGLQDILPRLLLSVTIVFIGYLLALLIRKLSKRLILLLDKAISDRLRNRSIQVDLKGSSVFISKAFFWIVFVGSLLVALKILRLDLSGGWLEGVILYLPNVLAAVVIIFVGIICGRLIGDLVASSSTFAGLSSGSQLGKVIRYLIIFVAVIISVDQLGIHVQFLTTLITILLASLLFGASLAFGLGAKVSVGNILGAYYARKSFKVGDKIQIGEISGVIVKITAHAITVESKADLIVIPAKDFNESKVVISKE